MILNTKVEEIMTREVFSVELEDTIHKADKIIREEKVKQVPVLENNKLVGLITERTLMEYTLRQLYDFDDEYGEIGYNKINDFQDVMAKNVRIIYLKIVCTKLLN
jgi:acetoin utilization protein AcuB